MSIPVNGYFYDHQLKSYILQFIAIFAGLQVEVGKSATEDKRLISVPIAYAHRDRVVASILSDNTQNKPLRLPTMSAYLKNIDLALDRLHGTGVTRRNAITPVGGLIPDDMRVVYQRNPMQYDIDMELGIYASNTNQHFQILEQILPLFDPQLNLQTSDSILDWTRLTYIVLKNINIDSNYPIGTDQRIIQSTLTFTLHAYLDIPANVRKNIVEKILVRIGAIGDVQVSNFDIVAELDQQGDQYEIWSDAATLNLDETP